MVMAGLGGDGVRDAAECGDWRTVRRKSEVEGSWGCDWPVGLDWRLPGLGLGRARDADMQTSRWTRVGGIDIAEAKVTVCRSPCSLLRRSRSFPWTG